MVLSSKRVRPGEGLRLGIDASNLRGGGGVTHLVELVSEFAKRDDIERIFVWGGHRTLNLLPKSEILECRSPQLLNWSLPWRLIWQKFFLPGALKQTGCSVLLAPGGTLLARVQPSIVMCRNMLPFEAIESGRYWGRLMWVKLKLLRFSQLRSFRRADGVIFLTDYARREVGKLVDLKRVHSATIPHGVSSRFFRFGRTDEVDRSSDLSQRSVELIYVSTIDMYKHQWCVVEAVNLLQKEGARVRLTLVGHGYGPAEERLRRAIAKFPGIERHVTWLGGIPHDKLPMLYQKSDFAIFASSCENMPNNLLEAMAAGLPIVCSNRGPMPEVLGDTGLLVDPESPEDIADAIKRLLANPRLCRELGRRAETRARDYTWRKCADRTFQFIAATERKA